MPKLTKRVIDNLKPHPEKDVFVWDEGDGALKGFGVRVKPSGAASYIVQYRNAMGRTRRMVIGKVGVRAPDEVRKDAAAALRAKEQGQDPSAERHAMRNAMIVSDLCDLYVKEVKGHIKDSTLKNDISRIECHVKPLIGRMAISSLRVEDIERLQSAIAAGKTAKKRQDKGRSGLQRGGKGVAARTVGMFGTILEFAMRRKLISENPARAVRKYQDNKRQRFLSHEEIKALGQAIRDADQEAMNATALAAIKTLLLTGCRKSEVLSLPWNWVDTKAGCIRFGDTKSGAQLRPIGCAATNYLQRIPESSQWVFPASRGDGYFIGLPRIFAKLCSKAEIEGATLHVLRHTFAAIAAELGYSELTIAGLLGHSVPGVTARYAHVPDAALVSAADRVSLFIADLLDGKQSGKVIEMKRG